MKLKSYPIKPKPTEGDYDIQKRFAWWPRRVENRLIWLEWYKRVYQFRVRERIHIFPGYDIFKVKGGGWDLITEQLIHKK